MDFNKKESTAPISRVLCHTQGMAPVIYLGHESPHGSSVLPSVGAEASDGQSSADGIRELAVPSRHSPMITHWLVVSYTTFSPLPSAVRIRRRWTN